MSELEPTVLHYYGPHYNRNVVHPFRDEIYQPIEAYQQGIEAIETPDGGHLNYAVAMMTEPPQDRALGNVPEVTVIRNPKYRDGRIVGGSIDTASLGQFAMVLHHGVADFEGQRAFHQVPTEQKSLSLGLEDRFVLNPTQIQNMGNRKDLTAQALESVGLGIPSYDADQLEQFRSVHGNIPIAYKPRGGANGRGFREFASLSEVEVALRNGEIDRTGLIQPFLDFKRPITGIEPYDNEANELIRTLNTGNNRPREVRMHVIAERDADGVLQVQAYPTLRCGREGDPRIISSTFVALDKDSMGPGHPLYDQAIAATHAIDTFATEQSGRQAPQFYGTLDIAQHNGQYYICDANWRGPRVPEQSHDARHAIINVLGKGALRNLALAA